MSVIGPYYLSLQFCDYEDNKYQNIDVSQFVE